MNKVLRFLIGIIVLTGMVACDDEPLEGEFGETPDIGPSSFEVMIDSTQFTGSQNSVTTSDGVTAIKGANESGNSVNILISGAGLGTYQIGSTTESTALYFEADNNEPYSYIDKDTLGRVEITKYDAVAGVASGNFDFAAVKTYTDTSGTQITDTLEFNEGHFDNISLTTDAVNPPDEGPSPSTSNFEVALDGELFTGQTTEAALNEEGLSIASNSGAQNMGLQVYNPEQGGTYDLNSEATQALVLYDPDTGSEEIAYASSAGSLTITSIDSTNQTVSGTFNGTLTEASGAQADIEMTDGVFENIPYSGDSSQDEGSALVDGEAFEANVFPTVTSGNQLTIVLDNDLDKKINLNLPVNNLEESTHTITASPDAYSADYIAEDNNGETVFFSSVADSGSIVISSLTSDRISGTFSFEGENDQGTTVDVTEGSFDVALP